MKLCMLWLMGNELMGLDFEVVLGVNRRAVQLVGEHLILIIFNILK